MNNTFILFACLLGWLLYISHQSFAQQYNPDTNTVALWHMNDACGWIIYDHVSELMKM